jgi:DNA-binding Lrp family transcriptional regulator
MPKSEAQLRQINAQPITWLSDGKLKLSILLRNEATITNRAPEALKYLLEERFSPAHVMSAFPSIAAPGKALKQKASEDYLRCILAKGIAEVYRKVTPKYRNEAARKQFFKRIADVTGMIHLSESAEKIREIVKSGPSDDDMTIWLSSELDGLIATRIDLSTEYHSRLNAARHEFAGALRQLESLVEISWNESDRFQPSLDICSFFPPGVLESENTWRWGTQWYPEEGVLNINPPVLFFDVLRKGVLAREAAILLSPQNLDTIGREPRDLSEQSEYLAYKLLERNSDKELWSELRHGLRQKTRFKAHELIDFFHFYEMMVGDSLYREVWSRLKEFGKTQLSFSDYLTIFNSLASRPTNPKFTEVEIRLLDLLSKRPNVGAGEAARMLGVSIPTAMKAIRDLSRKAGLSFTILVDMQKIRLVENLACIRTSRHSDVVSILSRIPYCRQVFRTYGSFDLFTVLDIPREYAGFPRALLERMVDRKLITGFKLVNLERDLQAVSLARYDVSQGRWDIHWDSWGLDLRNSLGGRESFVTEHPTQDNEFTFDKLDLNILSSLQINCRTPFSAIARTVGVSGAYVGRRVSKMTRQRLFRHAIWPLKIGAEDWALMGLSCTKDVARALAQNLSKLPAWRGGLVEGDFEGMLAIVWCPNGELKQFFKAIDDRLIKNAFVQAELLSSVGEWLIARWLPVDPDDPWKVFTQDGKWVFDQNHYMAMVP